PRDQGEGSGESARRDGDSSGPGPSGSGFRRRTAPREALGRGEGDALSMKELELSGRVAVVIGGTSGIGLALTQGLASAGADVIPISRRVDMVDQAAKSVESFGRKSLRLTAD